MAQTVQGVVARAEGSASRTSANEVATVACQSSCAAIRTNASLTGPSPTTSSSAPGTASIVEG